MVTSTDHLEYNELDTAHTLGFPPVVTLFGLRYGLVGCSCETFKFGGGFVVRVDCIIDCDESFCDESFVNSRPSAFEAVVVVVAVDSSGIVVVSKVSVVELLNR